MPNILICSFVLLVLLAANVHASPQMTIETIPASEGNCTYLPEGSGEFTIMISIAANRIKVWRVPTGTQQWEFRKLICDESGSKVKWACTWKYDENESIHDHFVLEIFGKDWEISESINATRRHAEAPHPQKFFLP